MLLQKAGRILGRGAIPVAAIFVLLCIVGTSWTTANRVGRVVETQGWVSHTQEVRAELEKLYGIIVTAESDLRAYVITEDEESFARYNRAERSVDASLSIIKRLTRDNSGQTPRLERLQKALEARFAALRATLSVRQAEGLSGVVAFLTRGPARSQGVRAMNEVRSGIDDLLREERRLLSIREVRNEGATLQAEIAFGFSLLISVLLISGFGSLSSRLVAQREAAAEEERAFREELQAENSRTREAEARLGATLVELRRSNEELQNFAFVASHDLQEPLRKIRAFSDRVRRRAGDALDEESKDSLVRVEAAADRMQRLILDLLELSRITTKVRPHVPIDLKRNIAEIVDDLQARLEETGGKVVVGSLPTVLADPAQMRQLFQNLIANALKFRREDAAPVATIKGSTREDGRVLIEVGDNGIGFEEKYADRIFVIFQRLHGRGEYEGSGIGLAIVRKIVERHGGTIVASGVPGRGATFRFDLPGVDSPRAFDSPPSTE